MLENHKAAIAEALRRGRNQAEVAAQYGVTRTAVNRFCKRHNIQNSGVFVKHRRYRKSYAIKCLVCGSAIFKDWLTPGAMERFCSIKCHGKGIQKKSLDDPREAIVMRLNDISWAEIARVYGHPQQSVQRAIWSFLFANDILSDRVMARIWRRAEGCPPAFNWLKKNSARYLTENARERWRNEDWKSMVVGLLAPPAPPTTRETA